MRERWSARAWWQGRSIVPAQYDTVMLNSDIGAKNVEAALWTLSGGTVAAGFEGGGQVSALTAVSQNGAYAVGGADNSAHNVDAVMTTLP